VTPNGEQAVIKNFDELKKQLAELVDVVNGFKSEQVQLRVMESLLANLGIAPASDLKAELDKPKPPNVRKTAKAKKKDGEATPAKNSGTRKSPKTAIMALIAEGYFAQHRPIGTVVSHLGEKKATTLSLGAVQMALNRLVQNGEMERGKNAEGQYEYWK
jgi:hypothetical protein